MPPVANANPRYPYHRQDDEDKCGAACAQMVLASIGVGIIDQAELQQIGHSVRSKDRLPFKGMSPEGLAEALNKHSKKEFHFSAKRFKSRATAERLICWSLSQGYPAPIALWNGGDHYVVVTDFLSKSMPRGPKDISLNILNFSINDPSPALARAGEALHPHAENDSCGPARPTNPLDYEEWQERFKTLVDRYYVLILATPIDTPHAGNTRWRQKAWATVARKK